MIEFAYLLAWTLVCLLFGKHLLERINHRYKVYTLILINCGYLAGLFYVYPIIREFARPV